MPESQALQELEQIARYAAVGIAQVNTLESLEQQRVAWLGRKSRLMD